MIQLCVRRWSGALLSGLLCAALAAPSGAHAANGAAIDWVEIAARTLPSTVNIQVAKVPLEDTDSGTGTKTTPGQRTEFDGSGFIVDPSGIIVTNKHVIDGAIHITVVFQDGTETAAKVFGASALVDLALLKVDVGRALPTLKLGNSDAIRPGEGVLAIGDRLGVGTSLSAGIVSGIRRDLMNSPFDDYIQTDAAINHGNSGGPLVNTAGEVIGVNSIVYTNEEGQGSIGIGFAISSNVLDAVVQHLLHPPVTFGWLGVHLQGMTPGLSRAFNAPNYGAIITEVEPDSSASAAGLKPGDVILGVDNQRPSNARSVAILMAISPIGATRTLKVWSGGKTRNVNVTVRAWQGATGMATINLQDPRCLPPPDPSLGLLLEPISSLERQLYSLGDVSGLVVVAVDPKSEAYGAGFRPGVVIQQINGQPVTTPESASKLLREARQRSSVVAILVSWSKGPSFFALSTGRDEERDQAQFGSSAPGACKSGPLKPPSDADAAATIVH